MAPVLTVLIAWGVSAPVRAANYYWDTTATSTWNTGSNWSTNSSSGSPGSTVPGSGDTATFNQSTVTGNETVNLAQNQSIGKIAFNNTGSTLIDSNSSTAYTLTIGTSGIAMSSAAGAVTIGSAANPVNIALFGSESWANSSTTNALSIAGGVTNSAATATTLTLSGVGSTAINGAIGDGSAGGTTAVAVTAGTVTLGGTNTYSGLTTVSASAATLILSGNGTSTLGGITLSNGTLDVNSTSALGSGTLALTGGTVNNTSGSAINSQSDHPAITLGSFAFGSGTGTSNNNVNLGAGPVSLASSGRTITLNGADVLTFGGALTNTTAAGATLTVNAGTGATSATAVSFAGYNLSNGTTGYADSINGSGNINFAGAVTDSSASGSTSSALTYSGTGTLTLGAASTYTGLTTIGTAAVTTGTLEIGVANAIASGNNLTNYGTFDLDGNAQTLGVLLNTGTVTDSGAAATLTFGAATTSTSAGAFSGTGLSVVINNGNAATTLSGSWSNGGNITNSGGGTGLVTLSGNIGSSVGTITQNSTTSGLVLSGANTNVNGVTIQSGTLKLGSTTALGATASTLTIDAGTSLDSTVANLALTNNNAQTWNGSFTFVGTNALNLGAGTVSVGSGVTVTTTANTLTVGGAITDNGNGLTKVGTGTLALTGNSSSTFTGGIAINAGVLSFANGSLGSGSIVDGAGTLQYAMGNTQDVSSQLSASGSNVLKIDVNGNAVIFGSQLTNTNVPNGLTVTSTAGGGSLTLNNNETYTGLTTIGTAAANSGTLKLGASGSGSLNAGDSVTTLAGGTFDINGNNTTLGGAITNGGIITNSGSGTPTLTMVGTGTSTDLGSITGALNLTYAPTGNFSTALLSLGSLTATATNATNTYSGTTTINSGTFALYGGVTLPNSSVVNNNGEFELYDNPTFTSSATRTSSLTLNGGGVLVSNNNASSYTTDAITTLTLGLGAYTNGPSINGTWTSNQVGFYENATSNSLLNITNLVVNPDATVAFSINSSGTLGGATIAAQGNDTGNVGITNFTVNGATYSSATQLSSVLVGGGGGINTTTTSILPFGFSEGGTTGTTWVTYTNGTGIQPITDFTTAITAGNTTNNVDWAAATNLTGALTVNSLILGSSGNYSTGTTTPFALNITSGDLEIPANLTLQGTGAVTLGTGSGNTATGYIWVINGLNGTISAPLQGPTAGLVVNYTSNNHTGSLRLENTGNNWSGGTIVNAGNSSATTNGVDPFTLQLGGDTATTNGTLGSGTVTLNNALLFFNEYNGYNYALTNVVAGSGAVTVGGSNTASVIASATNTYTGPTQINAGLMSITGSLAAASIVTVGGSTATVGATPTLNGTGTVNGSVIVAAANGGAAGIITPGTSSNLYGTLHVGGTMAFQMGSDLLINMSGSSSGELVIGGLATIAGGADLTINLGSTLNQSSYVLVSDASGGLNSSTPFTVMGTLPTGYSLVYTGTALDLVGTPPASAYYTGGAASNPTDMNTPGNFVTTAAGGMATTISIGSNTDVYLTANSAVNESPTLSTGAATVNSLTFTGSGTSATAGVSLSGTSTLTVGGGSGANTPGIYVQSGSGVDSISTPVALGVSQTWTSNSSNLLTVSGQISGGYALTKAGSGAIALASPTGNIYTGGTTVSAGKLYVNSGTAGSSTSSGTGSGAVTVNGGTLAGSGNIVSSGVTVNTGGTLASGDAQSATSKIVDGTHLTMTNTSVNIASANLTFDLGAGTSGINGGTASSHYNFSNPNNNTTYLSLTGSSTINFTGTDSISLVDLTNTTGSNGSLSLRLNSPYLLVNAGSNTAYLNLVINSGTAANPIYSLSQNDGTTNGWVVGVYTGSGPVNSADATAITFNQFGSDGVTPLTAGANGIYPDPVLYLDAGNLEVVPEPGTWGLMILGFGVLVLWQKVRRQNYDK
jgi:fibronectin-binding autotransporter adhesin